MTITTTLPTAHLIEAADFIAEEARIIKESCAAQDGRQWACECTDDCPGKRAYTEACAIEVKLRGAMQAIVQARP